MHIVVPIKQVPETNSVRMDPETGTMIRSGTETVVNPLDLYAVETALRLKERHGGMITAISMGPPPAESALREVVSMGCDAAVLLSDRRFGGSDTWATSYTLAMGIRYLEPCDLVITGERATDGDTSQVGPGIAAWLDRPLATYVAHMPELRDQHLTVERLVEEGYQRVTLPIPAVLTVVKEVAVPRLPSLAGKRRARQMEIPVLGMDELDLDGTNVGLTGSPTRVVKIASPTVVRTGERIIATDENLPESLDRIVAFLRDRDLV
jgi:electron transfer flavoprotein beta subunit